MWCGMTLSIFTCWGLLPDHGRFSTYHSRVVDIIASLNWMLIPFRRTREVCCFFPGPWMVVIAEIRLEILSLVLFLFFPFFCFFLLLPPSYGLHSWRSGTQDTSLNDCVAFRTQVSLSGSMLPQLSVCEPSEGRKWEPVKSKMEREYIRVWIPSREDSLPLAPDCQHSSTVHHLFSHSLMWPWPHRLAPDLEMSAQSTYIC